MNIHLYLFPCLTSVVSSSAHFTVPAVENVLPYAVSPASDRVLPLSVIAVYLGLPFTSALFMVTLMSVSEAAYTSVSSGVNTTVFSPLSATSVTLVPSFQLHLPATVLPSNFAVPLILSAETALPSYVTVISSAVTVGTSLSVRVTTTFTLHS